MQKLTTNFRTKSSVNCEKKLFSRDARSLVPLVRSANCRLFNRDRLVTLVDGESVWITRLGRDSLPTSGATQMKEDT